MKQIFFRQASHPKVMIVGVAIIAGALILASAGMILHAWFMQHPVYPAYNAVHPTAAQQEAIANADQWRSSHGGICEETVTPAIDKITGARHTFSDACLPPGWAPAN